VVWRSASCAIFSVLCDLYLYTGKDLQQYILDRDRTTWTPWTHCHTRLDAPIRLFRQQGTIEELADERDHDIWPIHKFVAKTIDESDHPAQSLQFIPVLRNHRADSYPLTLHWTSDGVVATRERQSGDGKFRDNFPLRPVLQFSVIGRHHLRLWDLCCQRLCHGKCGSVWPPEWWPAPANQCRQPIRSGGKLQPNDCAPRKSIPCEPTCASGVRYRQHVTGDSIRRKRSDFFIARWVVHENNAIAICEPVEVPGAKRFSGGCRDGRSNNQCGASTMNFVANRTLPSER
jgi:hypothetical protein